MNTTRIWGCMDEIGGLRKDMRGRGQGKSLGEPPKYNVVHSFDQKKKKKSKTGRRVVFLSF